MAKKTIKTVENIIHAEAKRKNIPPMELQSTVDKKTAAPVEIRYPRNTDLDPQLVWKGKDAQDGEDLTVLAPTIYIQEKVNPKVIIEDLINHSADQNKDDYGNVDLFSDFNGIPPGVDKTEFYKHDQNWSNRMILGDSLRVMSSLSRREDLKGKVQCIYIDPPYGIKFNSNFQWSTSTKEVKNNDMSHITREPEQVKAFRDAWKHGIHSYLSYLRDRFAVAKELLTDSGSIFVQIGDENVHHVRELMDEVFGKDNFVSQIGFVTTSSNASDELDSIFDYILWFSKDNKSIKYRQLYQTKGLDGFIPSAYNKIQTADYIRRNATKFEKMGKTAQGDRLYALGDITSARPAGDGDIKTFSFNGKSYNPGKGTFKTDLRGLNSLVKHWRIEATNTRIGYVRFLDDFPAIPYSNFWDDTSSSFMSDKIYVVQTNQKVIQRCILMTTDPGDLVLDPTCGSGTTAYVAEEFGRRWITIDTSRVALALARSRLMGARYKYYLLADSPEGQQKEGELTQTLPSTEATYNRIRQGFVYERVPHITLKSIANNAEIDVIWEKYRGEIEKILKPLKLEEWQVPLDKYPEFRKLRIARQKEIDASIAAKAEYEYLYDKPCEDTKKVRVAGPFTVESISPHRALDIDENDEFINEVSGSYGDALYAAESAPAYGTLNFADMILSNLRISGVQQAHKNEKIMFSSIEPFPGGSYISATGYYTEKGKRVKAAIFIGGEFSTVSRIDLVAAVREASEANFDVLISCAFNYDAHSTDLENIGRIKILKARMNADLHMSEDLRNTGKGNLFVIFGEPDITIEKASNNQIALRINGVDVYHPSTGEVVSDETDNIACWFIDTDYNLESFFVRQAYFLGANDPYNSLKRALNTRINEDAWQTLHSDISRPFDRPASGRIAVKVINHLGDEVMKVFKV
jgi:adenine-specific DNA-methyltransferase